jgi:hypothetical protein
MIRPNRVELLETRIAPAALLPVISADGKTATFVDVDGDVFTVTTTKGKFTAENFVYEGDAETGQGYLQQVDLSFESFGKAYQGAKISVQVEQFVGDGFADVGFVNAAGVDLKGVIIDGDLVKIDVGDANQRTSAIGRLQALQLGFHTPEEAGIPDFESTVVGRIEVLDIGSWRDAYVTVVGLEEKTFKFGSIGKVNIQNMEGGDATNSGVLMTTGSIGTLVLLSDLVGGSAPESGRIECHGTIGSLTIGGNVTGDAQASGQVWAAGGIKTGVIAGSILGGAGESSGSVYCLGTIKSLRVNGDVEAGDGFLSGSIVSLSGSAKSISIGGILSGGPSVSGIVVGKTLGKLELGTSDGTAGRAYIIAGGPLAGGVAIEKISVVESLSGARILAGYNSELEVSNPNVKIGKITVGGDLIATDIVAGIDGLNGVFGDTDDKVPTTDTKPKFLSSIASIIVNGMAAGTEVGTDQYGILAERIQFMKIDGVVQPLGKNRIDDLQLVSTGDYRLHEIVKV